MTRRSNLKRLRVEHPEALKDAFKDAADREPFPCPVCNVPMFLSIGQIQKCHPECKTEWKRIIKKQIKVGILNPDGTERN